MVAYPNHKCKEIVIILKSLWMLDKLMVLESYKIYKSNGERICVIIEYPKKEVSL